MAHIAVCHPSFVTRGGAESVCMNTVEALSADHNITLVSTSNLSIPDLNTYFDTDVRDVNTQQIKYPAQIESVASACTKRMVGADLPRLREAIFKRHMQNIAGGFDYIFCTRNELCIEGTGSAQYVHLPRAGIIYNQGRQGLPEFDGELDKVTRVYDTVCAKLERYDASCVSNGTMITNSEWTAALIEDIYGHEPHIVYPPIDKSAFSPRPWGERENGFVMVGKVCKEKNTLKSIRFMDVLRNNGHDVHLHIIGPEGDPEYVDDVVAAVKQREYIELNGTLPRDELIRMICTHRYGFHAMDQEHFGMAVAELITGGAIPFVPNSGGQVYIVNNEILRYETLSEAVSKAEQVLNDEGLQRSLHTDLLERSTEYDKQTFHDRIRSIVNADL